MNLLLEALQECVDRQMTVSLKKESGSMLSVRITMRGDSKPGSVKIVRVVDDQIPFLKTGKIDETNLIGCINYLKTKIATL